MNDEALRVTPPGHDRSRRVDLMLWLLVLLVPGGATAQAQTTETYRAEDILARGEELLEQDRFDLAIDFFIVARELAEARRVRERGSFLAAYAHYRRGSALDQDNEDASCYKAYVALQSLQDALSYMRGAGDLAERRQTETLQATEALIFKQKSILQRNCSSGAAADFNSDARARQNEVGSVRARRLEDMRRDPVVQPRPDPKDKSVGDFAVDIEVALTEPEAPIAGRAVDFLARVASRSRSESVERVELWIDGRMQGSAEGNVLDVTAGPFTAGRVTYEIVAVSTDERRSEPHRQVLVVMQAGNSTISGRITGSSGDITDVQLLKLDERIVAKSSVDDRGRYRFTGIPAGDYVVFVNTTGGARVAPTDYARIEVDGRRSRVVNFEVR